jgi:hypothetical protein
VTRQTPFSVGNNAPLTQNKITAPFPEPTDPEAASMLADFFRNITLDVDPNTWDQSHFPSLNVFEWRLGTSSRQRVLLSFTTNPKAARQFGASCGNTGPVIFIAQTRSSIGVPHASEGSRKLRYYFYDDPHYSQGHAEVFEMTNDGIMHKHGLSVGGWKLNAVSLLRVLQTSLGILEFPDISDAISIIARALSALDPEGRTDPSS